MMFKAPGWKPEELGGVEPLKEVSPATFYKYNTEISSGLTNYAFFQFVIVLLSTTAFLVLQGKTLTENWPLKTLMASLIILSLVNIGGIFERKTWVLVLEYLRIAAVAALVILLVKATAVFATVTVAVLVLGLVSMVWFTRYRGEFSAGAPAAGVEYVEKLN